MILVSKDAKGLKSAIENAIQAFEASGAELVDMPTLLPAELMLNIYGEEIRNNAFLVHDGLDGNFVLRPDFTVPIVQAHIANEKPNARYAYAGRVWRKKREAISEHKHSFWQVGLEIFHEGDGPNRDAEIFATAIKIAAPYSLRPRTGDLGLVFSLLDQMPMSDWRRAALKRQFWRPKAFEKLLKRYSNDQAKHAELTLEIPEPIIGLRSEAMIKSRIERLKEDAKTPPLKAEDCALLMSLLSIKGNLLDAQTALESLASAHATLGSTADNFTIRNRALQAAGIDLETVDFDASFGRQTMEYYDGFVFGLYAGDVSVISGGRYDQLTKSLGGEGAIEAVGMAFRPELVGDSL